jgi:hypothetical protein
MKSYDLKLNYMLLSIIIYKYHISIISESKALCVLIMGAEKMLKKIHNDKILLFLMEFNKNGKE